MTAKECKSIADQFHLKDIKFKEMLDAVIKAAENGQYGLMINCDDVSESLKKYISDKFISLGYQCSFYASDGLKFDKNLLGYQCCVVEHPHKTIFDISW